MEYVDVVVLGLGSRGEEVAGMLAEAGLPVVGVAAVAARIRDEATDDWKRRPSASRRTASASASRL